MMTKRLCQYLLGASLAMTMSFDASALTITPPIDLTYPIDPDPNSPYYVPLTFTGNSNPDILKVVDPYLSGLADLAYKQNAGGSEEGWLGSSYTTSFNSDASGATITYNGSGSALTLGPKYLLVKDGNHTPYAYLFDLTSAWNGTETLTLSGFWPDQGSISYVAIYTPDGGTTLILLGMALAGLGAARRFCRPSLS